MMSLFGVVCVVLIPCICGLPAQNIDPNGIYFSRVIENIDYRTPADTYPLPDPDFEARNIDSGRYFRGWSIYNPVSYINSAFQEVLNRQQQLLEVLYGYSLTFSQRWQNFLATLSSVPQLGWVNNPSANVSIGNPNGNFVAISNVNGHVTAVAGHLVDGTPVTEYYLLNNQIVPVPGKPSKPVKPPKVTAGTRFVVSTEMPSVASHKDNWSGIENACENMGESFKALCAEINKFSKKYK